MEDRSALQIVTSCFKITFERDTQATYKAHKNPDMDNIITCYQNAFYTCLKHSTQVSQLTCGTDARVREMQGWDWCAFRDIYIFRVQYESSGRRLRNYRRRPYPCHTLFTPFKCGHSVNRPQLHATARDNGKQSFAMQCSTAHNNMQ